MRRVAVLALLAAIGGCAEAPFVDQSALITLQKQDLLHTSGVFNICFNDGDADKVGQLARETCANYGLVPVGGVAAMRYQCKITAPHLRAFQCVDPRMRFADGTWVNPFRSGSVSQWRQQQLRRGLPLPDPVSLAPNPALADPNRPKAAAIPSQAADKPAPADSFAPLVPPLDWGVAAPLSLEGEAPLPPMSGWGQAWGD